MATSEQAQPAPAAAAKPVKPSVGRLPSLNQLAARINANAAAAQAAQQANGVSSTTSTTTTTTAAAAPRPRLNFNLRGTTGSTTSLSTTASTTDSLSVQPPLTRTASTDSSAVSTPPQQPAIIVEGGDSDLTSEKLEALNLQEDKEAAAPAPVEKPKIKTYKNAIPSLEAIAKRLEKTRALSVDGSAKPPEPEMIEDPRTPGLQIKAPEHPLQYPWTIYHDTKAKFPFTPATAVPPSATSEAAFPQPVESSDYEAGLTLIGEFSTVEEFCRYFNWLKPPSKLERNSNYHLFKSGIKPMWEDEANANGGKWVLTMKNNPQLLDRCWNWLAMALVGEELEEGDEICGAVVSLRSKVDRIQVWTRKKDDVERLNAIGKKLVKLLDVSEADGIGLEFQYNSDDRPLPNKFLSIQAMPSTSYRNSFQAGPGGVPNLGHARGNSLSNGGNSGLGTPTDPSGPVSAGPGGAFGAFGIGIGGAGWRGRRG